VEPAERCCGHCGGGWHLVQAVRMIASYMVGVGAFSVATLFTDGSKDSRGESEVTAVVASIHNFIRSLALIAGLQGIVGVVLQVRWRLGILLFYQVLELVSKCLVTAFRVAEACKWLARLHDKGKLLNAECSTVRTEMLTQFTVQTCIFAYLAFITWSLMKRLETGDLSNFEYGLELGNRAMIEETLADASNQRLISGSSNRPPPFSGSPQTLGGTPVQQQTMEPFRGTAHRLE